MYVYTLSISSFDIDFSLICAVVADAPVLCHYV